MQYVQLGGMYILITHSWADQGLLCSYQPTIYEHGTFKYYEAVLSLDVPSSACAEGPLPLDEHVLERCNLPQACACHLSLQLFHVEVYRARAGCPQWSVVDTAGKFDS
jgi:hypothetical protein